MRHRSNHARVLSRLLLVAALGLLAGCAHMRSGSATAQLDAFMQQERAWAGLTNHTATLPDGRRMPYSEGGPANAPTLILLHGYTGDRNHWNEVARDLTDRWHVIIPDLPGHGDTPLADDASADGMAQTLGHFVDSIGAQRYVLVGHSMGGGVAALFAMARPQQVRGLVLVDSAGVYADNPSPVMQAIAQGDNPLAIETTADYQRLLNVAMAKPPFIPDSIQQALATRAVAHRAAYTQILDSLLNTQTHLPPSTFHMVLHSLRMPTLVIWGRKDAIFDVKVTQELADNLPNATVTVFDDVGHTPIREAPRRTAVAIDGFVGGLVD